MVLTSLSFGRQAGFRLIALFAVVLALAPAIGLGQEPEPKTGSITGVVTDAQSGAPVPDVEVRLFSRLEGASRPVHGKITLVQTDASGKYRFEKVAPGHYGIHALHGTKASHSRHLDYAKVLITREGSSTSVDLKLTEARILKVRVLAEETGEPIRDAIVYLQWPGREDTSKTDEHGVAVIPGAPQQELPIQVKALDYQLVEINELLKDSLTEITVKLPPGGSIQGKVVDDKGQPLAGVYVFAALNYGSVRYDSATSDKNGKFNLNYVPRSQRMLIAASLTGYLEATQPVALNGATSRQIEMTIKPRISGGDVEVTVVDEAGRPIAGAEIVNLGLRPGFTREATTNAQGWAFLKDLNLPPRSDKSELTIRAERFAPSVVQVTRPESGAAKVTVTLEKGHSFRARIVNEAGEPISEATVRTLEGNRGGRAGLATTHAVDSKGRFAATTLVPKPLLMIEAPGYTAVNQMKIEVDRDEEQVITLDRTGHFRVVVVDGNTKQPVRKFKARLDHSSAPPPEGVLRGGSVSTEMARGKSFDDADGRLFWDNLPNNSAFDILIEADGYDPLRRTSVVTSRDQTDLRIELQPVDVRSLVEVAGIIRDSKGEPIEGVDVHLIGVDPVLATQRRSPTDIPIYSIRTGSANSYPMCMYAQATVTAADGTFKFPKVSKRLLLQLVYLSKDVPPMRIRDLEEKSAEQLSQLDVHAPRPVTLKGTIDLTKYPKPGRVSVEFDSVVDGRSVEIDPQDRSRYSISDLTPGELKVTLYSEQTRRRENGILHFSGGAVLDKKTITAKSGETIEVNFD